MLSASYAQRVIERIGRRTPRDFQESRFALAIRGFLNRTSERVLPPRSIFFVGRGRERSRLIDRISRLARSLLKPTGSPRGSLPYGCSAWTHNERPTPSLQHPVRHTRPKSHPLTYQHPCRGSVQLRSTRQSHQILVRPRLRYPRQGD